MNAALCPAVRLAGPGAAPRTDLACPQSHPSAERPAPCGQPTDRADRLAADAAGPTCPGPGASIDALDECLFHAANHASAWLDIHDWLNGRGPRLRAGGPEELQ